MEARRFTETIPPPRWRPEPPVRLRLADGLLAATQEALRDRSDGHQEAIVLWAGRATGDHDALVSHLILPEFVSHRHGLTIPQPERLVVANYLRRDQLLAFADLHTHPRRAFLSDADEATPFSIKDGFYAVVIPHFALGQTAAGWRFYEALRARWREVDPAGRIVD